MRTGNLKADIPTELNEELVTPLGGRAGVRIERIVSRGHASPPDWWYDQDEVEFVLLVSGKAVLELEGCRTQALSPGDWVEIPRNLRHRVASTDAHGDTVWLAVFYP